MSELPIPQEAVEAAAAAIHALMNVEEEHIPASEYAEAALRAGLEAMGMQPEQRYGLGRQSYRLVSRWLPVEQAK